MFNGHNPTWATLLLIGLMLIPLIVPPVGRWINLDITWDLELIKRFKKEEKMNDNVYNLPTPKLVPPMPKTPKLPASEKQSYSVGVDNTGNTILTIYTDTVRTSLTMNDPGVRRLIKMLEINLED
jgi:hypothetical protein